MAGRTDGRDGRAQPFRVDLGDNGLARHRDAQRDLGPTVGNFQAGHGRRVEEDNGPQRAGFQFEFLWSPFPLSPLTAWEPGAASTRNNTPDHLVASFSAKFSNLT
jgi:hypothetical protein